MLSQDLSFVMARFLQMMQSGSFEEERRLGEGIDLSRPSSLSRVQAALVPRNGAKCSGPNQDQRRLIGKPAHNPFARAADLR